MIELRATLDYETRSRRKLEQCGAIEYAKDPSTSIFCLGWKINDGIEHIWIPELSQMPEELWWAFYHGILVAHSAGFERAITKWCLPRYIQYGTISKAQANWISRIPINRWRCTAAKAAASSLPRSLEDGAKILKLKTQKDMVGSKLIKKYSKPRKPTKNNPNHWWCDPSDLQKIYSYCKVDLRAEYEMDQALPDLSPHEQRVWELDQKINDRGVLIDIPTVKLILTMIDEEMKRINHIIQSISKGKIETANQVKLILKWVNKHGGKVANLQAPTIRDRLAEEDIPSMARVMLECRQSGSKTSTGKYIAMLRAVGKDHRARELLLYNGAVPTARWSGKRVQPHNFARPTVKNFNMDEAIECIKQGLHAVRMKYGDTNVMDVLVSAARGMLIASPGKELYCADFAAVEARLAFWFADHKEGIEAFRNGGKLYEEMAAEAFDMEVEDIHKDSLERFVGKESVLGCQFGMGPPKFMSQCHKKGKKQVTLEIADKVVSAYRRKHHPVPEMWGNLETAAIQAIQSPGQKYATNKVVFYVKGKWLNIKLPSGRRLRYYKPHLRQKQLRGGWLVPEIRHWGFYSINGRQVWGLITVWGGVFANHIIQGTARDLMACGMMNIEEAGYDFLLSIHDEGLSEKDEGQGSVKEYVALMTKLPAWADGAPIDAEGWSGQRYHK